MIVLTLRFVRLSVLKENIGLIQQYFQLLADLSCIRVEGCLVQRLDPGMLS